MTILVSRRMALAGAAGLIAVPTLSAPALAQARQRVRFTLDWRFEAPAAMFTVALDKGYYAAEGLEVTIDVGNGSRESIPRVASGTYDMGFGDINSQIRFMDETPGAPIKSVMMVYDKPPFSIVGRRSLGITPDAKSLEGKKLGAPQADSAYAQWPIFRTVNNLNEATMNIENVGFPVREPMLATGQVAAIFGFANSLVTNLTARGVPESDLVVMLMANYGVELYGNTIMVGDRFMRENPNAIRGFLKAFMRSVKDVVADPAGTLSGVLSRNDVAKQDQELTRQRLTLSQFVLTDYVKANGFGDVDEGRFNRAIDQIGLTFTYKNKPKMSDIFTREFLPPVAERRLVGA